MSQESHHIPMVVGLYPHFWRLNSVIANIPQLMEVIIIVIPCYTIVIATTVCNIYIYIYIYTQYIPGCWFGT